jgi:hypothetical protein
VSRCAAGAASKGGAVVFPAGDEDLPGPGGGQDARRGLLRAEDTAVNLGEFLRLGATTVPAALAASTLMLWSGVKVGL